MKTELGEHSCPCTTLHKSVGLSVRAGESLRRSPEWNKRPGSTWSFPAVRHWTYLSGLEYTLQNEREDSPLLLDHSKLKYECREFSAYTTGISQLTMRRTSRPKQHETSGSLWVAQNWAEMTLVKLLVETAWHSDDRHRLQTRRLWRRAGNVRSAIQTWKDLKEHLVQG